jgi:hypothetical protein
MMPTANVGDIDGGELNLYPAYAPAPVIITPARTATPIHVLFVIVDIPLSAETWQVPRYITIVIEF